MANFISHMLFFFPFCSEGNLNFMLREYLAFTLNICSKREYFLCSFLTHKRCSNLGGEEEEEKSETYIAGLAVTIAFS